MAKQSTNNEGSCVNEVNQKESDLGLVRRQDKFTESIEIESHLCDRFHYAHNTRPSDEPPRPIKN